MIRKAFLSIFLLIGMLFLAFCSSNQTSPIPETNTISPTFKVDNPSTILAANMSNPASIYCEQNSSRLEIRKDVSDAEAGIYIVPEGSECDE